MPTNLVNLDALIPRQDFEFVEEDMPEAQPRPAIDLTHLEPGNFFYFALRKPDFQRETASWSPEKVADFIATFLNNELIPSIIMWRSGGNIFVIDGAHRLSALIAWVHNDYGDGSLSHSLFQHLIPPEQQKAADRTRKLVEAKIGSYADHKKAVLNPSGAKPDILERAKQFGSLSLNLQWVLGNADKAEESFFKINQLPVPIDATEMRILKGRKKANALAARAIMRAGTGHKYWKKFSPAIRIEIEQLAKEIYDALFLPPIDTPIKTLDLPVGGHGYSGESLPLIFDFVNIVNGLPMDSRAANPLNEDTDGSQTIEFLKTVRRFAFRISSVASLSLGLHPVVYFYGANSRYQPTAFLAVVDLLTRLEKRDAFKRFAEYRAAFETFLLDHKTFVNQVTVKWGSKAKGYQHLADLFDLILSAIEAGKSGDEIFGIIKGDPTFAFLQLTEPKPTHTNAKFSTDVKSATALKQLIDTAPLCNLCHARMHVNAMSVDHKKGIASGGIGDSDNAQMTHPYCNSIKN